MATCMRAQRVLSIECMKHSTTFFLTIAEDPAVLPPLKTRIDTPRATTTQGTSPPWYNPQKLRWRRCTMDSKVCLHPWRRPMMHRLTKCWTHQFETLGLTYPKSQRQADAQAGQPNHLLGSRWQTKSTRNYDVCQRKLKIDPIAYLTTESSQTRTSVLITHTAVEAAPPSGGELASPQFHEALPQDAG